MKFTKAYCPRPPHGRGPARKQYRMSDDALWQRRQNLSKARLRLGRERQIIRLLIWQAYFGAERRPSQRALAHQLGVWPSYVHKVQRRAESEGRDALAKAGRRVTLDDLIAAQRYDEGRRLGRPSPQAATRTISHARTFPRKRRYNVPLDIVPWETRRITYWELKAGRIQRETLNRVLLEALEEYNPNDCPPPAPARTADENIAEQRRFAEEWKRKNPARNGSGRRIAFSVRVPRGAWSPD